MNKDIVILIPSYEPTSLLIDYINELNKYFKYIIVVNDGSNSSYDCIFNNVNALVIGYQNNHGKGYALKYGYQYIKDNLSDIKGIICVDSDGQHLCKDVLRIADRIDDGLVLGVRDFKDDSVPFKSKFGNSISSFVFYVLYGKWLSDTQTGLRGFSVSYLDWLLGIKGNRFEYESQVLIECVRDNILIDTIGIDTVYVDNNEGTHFKAFRDSFLVMKVLFGNFIMFFSTSLFSSIVDLGLAWLLMLVLKSYGSFMQIMLATIIARVISIIVNYNLNSKFVFNSSNAFKRYLCLALGLMVLSGLLVFIIVDICCFNELIVKPIVDGMLFLISYQIQNRWVFKEVKDER